MAQSYSTVAATGTPTHFVFVSSALSLPLRAGGTGVSYPLGGLSEWSPIGDAKFKYLVLWMCVCVCVWAACV
jgi:hypothetical protein